MKKMVFEVGKKFPIEVAANGITEAGVAEICAKLREWGYCAPDRHALDFEWVWLTKRGTLPKRLSSWLRKAHSETMTQKHLSDIGALAARHCDRTGKYLCDFTRDFGWRAGDFGDDGSCYWSDRSAARDVIRDHGGYAFRFYNPEEPAEGWGRCWILPVGRQAATQSGRSFTEEPFIMFNGYHAKGSTLITMARILATWKGLHYQKVRVSNMDDDDLLYLNSGTGYLLGLTNEILGIEEIALEIDVSSYQSDDRRCCDDCREPTDDDDLHSVGDNKVCNRCYKANYFYCELCCENYHNDDGRSTYEGYTYCESCADDFERCNDCGDYIARDRNKYYVDDENGDSQCYCPDCKDAAQRAHDEREKAKQAAEEAEELAQQEKEKTSEQSTATIEAA